MDKTIIQATAKDLPFVLSLQKKFSNQIGFIPKPTVERYLEAGKVFRGDLNEQEAGFLLLRETPCQNPEVFSIVQAAVKLDAQRHSLGFCLTGRAEKAAKESGGKLIQAACREDLDSNYFWRAAGFTLVAMRAGGQARGQRVLLWRKAVLEGTDLRIFHTPKYNLGANGRFCKRSEMEGWKLVEQRPI